MNPCQLAGKAFCTHHSQLLEGHKYPTALREFIKFCGCNPNKYTKLVYPLHFYSLYMYFCHNPKLTSIQTNCRFDTDMTLHTELTHTTPLHLSEKILGNYIKPIFGNYKYSYNISKQIIGFQLSTPMQKSYWS